MDAAVKLFSTRGFTTASVDDICEEAGISKGAFYHHFETKQAHFLALLDGCKRSTALLKHPRISLPLKHLCK